MSKKKALDKLFMFHLENQRMEVVKQKDKDKDKKKGKDKDKKKGKVSKKS